MKLLSEENNTPTTDIYYESKSRFFQLLLFLGALISNVMFGFSLSPITYEISMIYGVSKMYIFYIFIILLDGYKC